MATLKSIRKRIASVKNTQKITRAMKMVAAAKLRRAQQALTGARPHLQMLEGLLHELLASSEGFQHPLLTSQPRLEAGEPAPSDLQNSIFVLTSDRGLCGGFNGNLLRRVEHFIRHEAKDARPQVTTLGRKGRDYYRAKRIELKGTESWPESIDFGYAQGKVEEWAQGFRAGEYQTGYLAFNHFLSAISQEPQVQQFLPLKLAAAPEEASRRKIQWEGEPAAILDELIRRYLATKFYIALLESQASELGSRMSAMENATNNAKDMMGSLTLIYNRARQAAITTELMDIVNGAEAL